MFTIKEDSGNRKSKEDFLKLPTHITKGIRMGAYISGKQLVKSLRDDMNKPKSGRTYRKYKGVSGALSRPKLYKASSPNQTPAVVTGQFRKSIGFKVVGNKSLEFGSGSDGLAKAYAQILEEGSSKMAARKPLGRTVAKFGNKVNTNITKEINKQIRSLGVNLTNR